MDTINELIAQTVATVEATSYESLCIWREVTKKHGTNSWQQHMGEWRLIGYINGDADIPVCVCYNFNTILGKTICFWENTGRYFDYEMVEKYNDTIFCNKPNYDAMNFHNCMNLIRGK